MKKTLDEELTDGLLFTTVKEALKKKETARSAKHYFIATVATDAIFEQDIGNICTIINRIDGLVPSESDLHSSANYFADAMQDVLNSETSEQTRIMPDDPVIIALAKVVYFIAVTPCTNQGALRKNKNMAIELILSRCGGRKEGTTQKDFETLLVEPAWLESLPEGEEDV